MPTRPLLLLLLLAAPWLAGCPRRATDGRQAEPDLAAIQALDSSVALYAGLERAGREPYVVGWGGLMPVKLLREQRWEELDGVPHLRVAFMNAWRPTEDDTVEWLRPAGDRLVCPARRLGKELHRLDPPQPLLVGPVEVGRTWRWEGTAGGVPATAEFRVRSIAEQTGPQGERWRVAEVEQVTTTSGVTGRRVVAWAAGHGHAAEETLMLDLDGAWKPFHGRAPREGEWLINR